MSQHISSGRIHESLEREWLAVNHLGGYACSTLPGLNTRKYHGLLVAAMAPPVRRMVILSRMEETVSARGRDEALDCAEYPGVIHPQGHQLLRAFSHEPYPRWAYQGSGWTIDKSVRLIQGQNTICISYTLLAADQPIELKLRPLLALRGIHELTYQWNGRLKAQRRSKQSRLWHIPPTARTPEVFFTHDGDFDPRPDWYLACIYRREQERGYAGLEDLWTPGLIQRTLAPGQSLHFVCSTEPVELESAIKQVSRQFIRSSAARLMTHPADPTREALSRASTQCIVHVTEPGASETIPLVITGFPWSPPSLRDALIGFHGLFLATGRASDGRKLLQWLATKVQNGLIPSELPEDGSAPIYRSADASLWFIHAVHQYLRHTGDSPANHRELLRCVVSIVQRYHAGTSLGIGTDENGLLHSRAPGIGTTWMDAQIGEWVITPRQGRPVELNALWYSALSAAAEMCRGTDQQLSGHDFVRMAAGVKLAFNQKFWNAHENCCFDVLADNGADPSVRPNQILAISLPFPVLDAARWAALMETVEKRLLTPMGLRTLAPGEPSYHGRYAGDVHARDRAHHQGSAFPWLLGHFIAAALRTYGDDAPQRLRLRALLHGCLDHLHDRGLGNLPELFDGDAPHAPGGAIASARSVAEILRAYVETTVLEPVAPAPSHSPMIAPSTEVKAQTSTN